MPLPLLTLHVGAAKADHEAIGSELAANRPTSFKPHTALHSLYTGCFLEDAHRRLWKPTKWAEDVHALPARSFGNCSRVWPLVHQETLCIFYSYPPLTRTIEDCEKQTRGPQYPRLRMTTHCKNTIFLPHVGRIAHSPRFSLYIVQNKVGNLNTLLFRSSTIKCHVKLSARHVQKLIACTTFTLTYAGSVVADGLQGQPGSYSALCDRSCT